jgi:hypothetical protein
MTSLCNFRGSKQNFETYPHNLLRTDHFPHELEAYTERLDAEEHLVFHPRNRSLFRLHYSDLTKEFSMSPKQAEVDQLLEELVKEDVKDPICQYLFIHAVDSRAPLSVGREQLLLILTHLQAMSTFLDHIFTFRRRESPHLHAHFSCEDTLDSHYSHFSIEELGRSGLQIQHCFNLIGVENDSTQELPWLVCQTAAHFVFDVVGGQASWILVKANDVVRKRLQKDVNRDSNGQRLLNLSDPKDSFLLAMRTHLLLFDWCAENWSKYVDFLEDKVASASTHLRHPATANLMVDKALKRRANMRSPQKHASVDGLSHKSRVSSHSRPRRLFELQHETTGETEDPNWMPHYSAGKAGNRHKSFDFGHLQTLHNHMDMLVTAGDVVKQNMNVMDDIVARFEGLQLSTSFSSILDIDTTEFEGFYSRVRVTIRHLESQLARIQANMNSLEKVSTLFTAMLQYSSMKASESFALHAEKSLEAVRVLNQSMHELADKRMHEIVSRTQKDTASIQIIALVTLFFLPGTFVATLFSTTLFEIDLEDNSPYGMALRPRTVKAFVTIYIPLMVAGFSIWAITVTAHNLARRKQHKAFT